MSFELQVASVSDGFVSDSWQMESIQLEINFVTYIIQHAWGGHLGVHVVTLIIGTVFTASTISRRQKIIIIHNLKLIKVTCNEVACNDNYYSLITLVS